MIDEVPDRPAALAGIERDSARLGFAMACEHRTGALLRMLAASKPGARVLELGTGTGASTAWLLAGMTGGRLLSIDADPAVQAVARTHLGGDARLELRCEDGGAALERLSGEFELIFADAWPGKYSHLDEALARLAPGGFYVIDDMLPQPTWPDGHAPRVEALLAELDGRGLRLVRLAWASGLVVAVRAVPLRS